MHALSALSVAWLLAVSAPASAVSPIPPGLVAGMKVAVLGPGEGVDIAAVSRAVGPQGRVYVLLLTAPSATAAPAPAQVEPNVRISEGGSAFGLGLPEPLDYAWLTTRGRGGPYMAAIASGLKSGGRLLVAPAPDDPKRLTAEAQGAGLAADYSAPGSALRFHKP